MPASGSGPDRLLVIGILSLLVAHISPETWSSEVSGVLYGRLGSPITLTCRGSWMGVLVDWRVNGSSVLPAQAVQQGSSLTLPETHSSMEGLYSCHDQTGALIDAMRLRLGHPPGHVNVTCRLPNHETMYCSWTKLVESSLPTHYHSTYVLIEHGFQTVRECDQRDPDSPRCVIEHLQPWLILKRLVNITEVNPLGSNTTLIRIDLQKIMKPDPPEDVSASEVEGHPTKLQVKWRIPETWGLSSDSFPLAFHLRYRPVGSKLWSMRYLENITSLMITDALAGHLHHIQVQARDAIRTDGKWSDWSPLVQAQPWTEPPLVTEEPTDIPELFSPEQNNTDVDTSTVKRPDSQLPDGGSQGLVLLLSLFAGIVGIVGFTVVLLLWIRHQRRGGLSKQQLTSMVKMKSLLI